MSTQQAERSTTGGHGQRGSRRSRLALALTVPVGVLASGAMVWQASYAAFTATTENANNSWATGTVVLTDNDSGAVLFNVSGLDNDDTATKCITVTYSGTLAANVRLYATGVDGADTLASYIDLVVEEGSGATDAACTGFVAANPAVSFSAKLSTMPMSWAAPGALNWPASQNTSKSYRITYNITDGDENAQGKTADASFVWEARSTGA